MSIEVPALINGSVVLVESALSLSSTTEVIGSLQMQGNSSVLVLGSGSIVIGGMHHHHHQHRQHDDDDEQESDDLIVIGNLTMSSSGNAAIIIAPSSTTSGPSIEVMGCMEMAGRLELMNVTNEGQFEVHHHHHHHEHDEM